MKENFIKFKKKILLEVLIKCIVIALSVGLITFSCPLIYIKVKDIDFSILYLILISLGVSLLLFGILFLILKPNDKKVAIKLDNELNLNEKVQTMIEYENKEGLIIDLQRKETLTILSNTSIKKLTMKFSVFFFVLIFIAMSLCISAFAIPSNDENYKDPFEQEIVDPSYDLDNWTINAIKDLIEYVEKSDINSSLKTKYVGLLNGLIIDLEDSTKESQMREIVKTIIANIKKELDIVNTNNEIYTVLKTAQYRFIVTLANQINNLDLEQIKNAIDAFIVAISGEKEAILEIDSQFGQILKNSNLDKSDETYIALIDLSDAINNCYNSSNLVEDLNLTVENHSSIILECLSKQKVNSDVSYYVIDELIEIFGLEDEYETFNPGHTSNNNNQDGNNNDDDDDNDDEQDKGGGLGKGEELFGSDDAFFDPESGKVIYGDVLAKYQNDILGKLDEGIISEELKEYFEFYYDILIGTLEDEE